MQTFLLDGEGAATQDGLDLCLGCQRCVPACPVSIDTPAITNRLKAKRRSAPMSTLRRRLLKSVLSPRTLDLSRRGLIAASALGITRRWHRRTATARDFIPQVDSAPPVRPGHYPATGVERARVWLFPGCVMNSWYRQVHWDTLGLLTKNGVAVDVPSDSVCCGALHEHAGQPDVAESLMMQNARVFAGSQHIVTNSAGCGAFFKQHPNPLQNQIRDLSEFLWELGMVDPLCAVGRTAAVHDPCHLAYAQNLGGMAARLLQKVGYHVAEWHEREACCGSAGTYNLDFPQLSWQLAQEKAEDLLAPRPDLIVTANPGCLMQIRAGADALGATVPVVHLATALHQAYQGADHV
jgi:glycolate oxidase iron-sulfur subunit